MTDNTPHPFIDKKTFMSMVERTIIPSLRPHERARLKLLRLKYIMWFVSILIFILLNLLNHKYRFLVMKDHDELQVFFFISALPVAYAYAKIHSYVKKKKDSILPQCFSFLGDLKMGQSIISSNTILESKLLKNFNHPKTDEEFSGRFADTTFSLSEKEITTDSGKNKKTVFKGIFIAIRMHKPIHGHTVIFNCSFFTKPSVSSLEKVEIEDPEFMNENYIYSNDQIETRYILTPAFIERLKALKMAFDTKRIDMAFFNGYALLALHCSHNLFETFTINRPVTDTQIFSTFYDEMLALKNLIETLKMDNVN